MSKFSLTKEQKISPESAQAEVQKILQFYHVDIDLIKDPKALATITETLEKLVEYFRLGYLEVQDDKAFTVVQHLQQTGGSVKTITYGEFTGESKIGTTENPDAYERMYAFMGKVAGVGRDAIYALKGIDLKVVESLSVVFFRS